MLIVSLNGLWRMPVFSVQYHPEAAPGPHDSLYLFERFRRIIEGE